MRLLFSSFTLTIVIAFAGCGGSVATQATPNLLSGNPPVNTSTAGTTSSAASGPQTSWMVVTLPNQKVTPGWQKFAPQDCLPDPSVCGQDHRFWEEWDFASFREGIDASFAAIRQQGKYQGVMVLMPIADSPTFWNNVKLMFDSANAQGLAFQAVVFPKNKYGGEECYLYPNNAPGDCAVAPGSSTAFAYQHLLQLMNYVENLGGSCSSGQSNRPVAVWYGWSVLPGYEALSNFWNSLPTQGCNLRASYITWLDTMYNAAPEVAQMQQYVVGKLHQAFHVNTELYNEQQIEDGAQRYAPDQTVITGFPNANDTSSWAQGMCVNWKTAGEPSTLGVWNFSDRDITPVENYAAIINGSMATPDTMCAPAGSN